MSFAENLQFLRQKKGYTQEQLAEQLQVSRQSVSKWESAGSYPEMEKLLQISELFQCSMDILVQGDAKSTFVDDRAEYDRHMNQRSIMAALGIGTLFMGAAAYELIVGVSIGEHIAQMVSMCFAVVGILIMIVCGLLHEEFKRRYKTVGNLYKEKEINKCQKKFITIVAVAIGIILFGVIISSSAEGFAYTKPFNEEFVYGIFMILVAIAVALLTYVGVQKEKYKLKDYEQESKEERKIEKICGVIMLTATGIFLLMGILANRWDISWVAFPIGGIACGISSILVSKE